MDDVAVPQYAVRVSERAKRMSIRVDAEGKVEVVVPRRVSERRAHAFVRDRERWVRKTVAKQLSKASKKMIIRWSHGERIPFLGRTLTLAVTPGNRKTSAFLRGDVLHVCCNTEKDAKAACEHWYREQARIFFTSEVRRITDILGVRFGRIAIKKQSTLWGSCSRKGNLNFNRKLMFAPQEVAQYIAVHECAHLVHLNHSRAFWSLVASLCPEYKNHHAWLKEEGVSVR